MLIDKGLRYPIALTMVNQVALDPIMQRAADHRCNRFDRSANRRMFATLLAGETYCTFANFREKLGCLPVHGSVVSRVEASTKSGAMVRFSGTAAIGSSEDVDKLGVPKAGKLQELGKEQKPQTELEA